MKTTIIDPLKYIPHPTDSNQFGVITEDGIFVGTVNCIVGERFARLFSAAPALLEACENLENDDGSIPAHPWEMIQAAIAKARGTKIK